VLPNSNQKNQVKEFRIKIISLIGIRHKCLLCCIHVLVIFVQGVIFFSTNLLVYNIIINNINVILTFTTLKKIDKITLTT
jgi:hypothetical protein